MSNYLVTGAAGFIGARTAEILIEQGHTVTGIDNMNDAYDPRMKEYRLGKLLSRRGFTFHRADISHKEVISLFDGQKFDGVINLAARAGVRFSVENPWVFVESNITGTLNMLEICKQTGGGTFIVASTSSIYGANPPYPTPESASSSEPLQPYAASKKGAEAMTHAYHHLYGINTTVLRFFTVYGPAGRPDLALFRFVQWILEGRPVHIYGDGEQSRGFTYIDDIVRGIIAALRPLGHEIINLGGHEVITINALVSLIEHLTGKKAHVINDPPNPADMFTNWADVSKARELLDWSPEYDMRAGTQKLIEWYLAERSWANEVLTLLSLWQKAVAAWREDNLLRRVIKNSGHLLSGNVVTAALGFAQGILAVRLIGITDWGLVTTVITFASNINRLLTFRMSEVVVKRLGEAATNGNKLEAAASVKAAMLAEAATSIAAYIVLAALTPWAANTFAKNLQTGPLFLFYGLILLTNLVAESSTGVLQAQRRFNWIARINIIQSLFTAAIILYAFIAGRGIYEIVFAYVIGKSINGIGLAVLAIGELNKTLGNGWWNAPLHSVPEKRSMLTFMLNTNFIGTINLFTRDNIPLYLAALLSTTQVGYFKLAQSLINLILLPLDPLIWPTYAEISRTVAQKQWDATRRLLRRVSLITASVVLSIGGFLALTGWFLLPLFYGAQALPAYPVLLILLVGYGFASIFQWNRPLLLALGKPGYPVIVSLVVGLVELALIFSIVPRLGYLALAGILSAYFVTSISIIIWRGFDEIKRQSLISE